MKKFMIPALVLAGVLVAFNNCGQSFEARKGTSSAQSQTSPNVTPNPNPNPMPLPTLPNPNPMPTPLAWMPTSQTGVPMKAFLPSAVSTGSKMITWGGHYQDYIWTNTGGILDAATNTWTATNLVGAPAPRYMHSAVWTGSKMIIWGGMIVNTAGQPVTMNTGAVFDPANNTWSPMSVIGAPSGRYGHSTVWTGSKMIVFGGNIGIQTTTNTGAAYDPVTNTWTAISLIGAPTSRTNHAGVFAGGKMVIYGGGPFAINSPPIAGGGVYDPANNTWSTLNVTGAPSARSGNVAIAAGNKMVIQGGAGPVNDVSVFLKDGGIYDVPTNTWTAMNENGAPTARMDHMAVWTGSKMIVFGGTNLPSPAPALGDGGIFDLATNSWAPIPLTGAPAPRYRLQMVWCTDRMIVYGGWTSQAVQTNTGGILY